jgi:hypothetical protein
MKATKSHRIYFQLAVKTLPTEGIEFGLLQTPRSVMMDETPEAFQARKKKNGYVNGTKYPNLLSQVKYGMLPTPIVSYGSTAKPEQIEGMNKVKNGKRVQGLNLKDVVENGMLPTPLASEGGKMSGSPTENQMSVTKLARMGMLPTPVSSDQNSPRRDNDPKIKNHLSDLNNFISYQKKDGKNSQLNPLFVEEMMGFPENWTLLPFQSGETKVSKPTETQSSPK